MGHGMILNFALGRATVCCFLPFQVYQFLCMELQYRQVDLISNLHLYRLKYLDVHSWCMEVIFYGMTLKTEGSCIELQNLGYKKHA